MRASDESQPFAQSVGESRPSRPSRREMEALTEGDEDFSNSHRCRRNHGQRCAMRCASRSPRFTKRRVAYFMLFLCSGWFVAVCLERRVQRNTRIIRQKLVAFLQEATFDVVEVGRVSEAWQFPVRRRLPTDMRNESDEPFPRMTEPGVGGFNRLADNRGHQNAVLLSESAAGRRRRKNQGKATALGWWGYSVHEEKLPSALTGDGGFNESPNRCPLIYRADVKTANKHGLYLSEDELKLLGTVTARLCRCLCKMPATNFQNNHEEQYVNVRVAGNTTVSSGQAKHNVQKTLGSRRMHRRLGMCEGVEYTSMLEEMMKGANVVVSGDSGWYYEWFSRMKDAHLRMSSHFSTRSTLGIHEGVVLRALLAGSNMYGDSWFQLEGAGWHPFRHPLEGILHAIYFVQYILQHKQVGPLGKSTHTDHQPITVTFDGCVREDNG